jgi:hypothetical protein
MASGRCISLAGTTAFLALLLIASPSRAEPADPAPVKVTKQTIYNGASRYVHYQVPPDAPPRIQALYSDLGQAENDQYLADQLQQLLLEDTEQERMVGKLRTSREFHYGASFGYTSPSGVAKAAAVQRLVEAAEVRSRFGGQVNQDLEMLQKELAGKANAGGMGARDAVREEPVALEKPPEAQQGRLVTQKERTATLPAEAPAPPAPANSAVASPDLVNPLSVVCSPVGVLPFQPAAEQGVSSGLPMFAGLGALGALLLIRCGMPLLLQ